MSNEKLLKVLDNHAEKYGEKYAELNNKEGDIIQMAAESYYEQCHDIARKARNERKQQ